MQSGAGLPATDDPSQTFFFFLPTISSVRA